MINPCGYYCEECHFFQSDCKGCDKIEGKPFWIEHYGNKPCPIYTCSKNKNFNNCGQCSDLPCKIWYDLHDPSLTDEEHFESIRKRVKLLKDNL